MLAPRIARLRLPGICAILGSRHIRVQPDMHGRVSVLRRPLRNRAARYGIGVTLPRRSIAATDSLGIDVFRLRTLLALGHFETDALALCQGPAAGSIDGAEVHEHVRAAFSFDESETFCIVKPFDGAGDALS